MINNEFIDIRNSLIEEANTSPNMLSDIAGLESYVSESYNNRSFIELLQNADDARSSKFLIVRIGDYFLIANNGREFTKEDLLSLCRSAASNKERGSSIGYRGIGFKSVVNIAKEIHIISGDLQITFSRELTREVVPLAKRVPLIRIPHTINHQVLQVINSAIKNYKDDGYTTFFVFSGVTAEQIEEEYKTINNSSLLFLKNISEVDNRLLNSKILIEKEAIPGLKLKVRLTNYGELLSEWIVYSSNNVNIAFSCENGCVKRLDRNDALAYAFLPTEDITGLGVLVNADFSTDPSRRHLINDELTKHDVKMICKSFSEILCQYISEETNHARNIINSIAPYSEPSFAQFAGTQLEKLFYNEIKEYVSLNTVVFKPTWINQQDFLSITKKMRVLTAVNSDAYPTMPAFLKYLGARELTLEDLSKPEIINTIELSILGSSQIASKLIKNIAFINSTIKLDELSLFYCNSKRCSLAEINATDSSIDESYLNTLFENGLSNDELVKVLQKFNLEKILSRVNSNKLNSSQKVEGPTIKNEYIDSYTNENHITDSGANNSMLDWYHKTFKNSEEKSTESKSDSFINTKAWRRAEQLVQFILNNNGFTLDDVSAQNLGYDLEGTDPDGTKIFVEVKSITSPGQSFKMTNNEYAVAQVKGDVFFIAVAYVNENALNLALYRNPIKTLNLNRQCVQWVWECNEYTFNPQSFDL